MKKQIKSKPLLLSAFQKWMMEYYTKKHDYEGEYELGMLATWNECKKQCLAILNKHKSTFYDQGCDEYNYSEFDYIEEDAIKEIEKL